MTTERFEVRNRWTDAVQFIAEIECAPDASVWVKLGLAVCWAHGTGASLVGANLFGARLDGARLDGASLFGASLDGANLFGARLDGARLGRARLDGARLDGASLVGASLVGASLVGASLDGASLVGANLVGASLDRASLFGASLDGASLVGARLDGAHLDSTALRPIKADLWMVLAMARHEVPALIRALEAGKVDGSIYEGRCRCLVGTLEGAGATGLPHAPLSPAESWFAPIRPRDAPDKDGEGPFRARQALVWAKEFCAVIGIDQSVEVV